MSALLIDDDIRTETSRDPRRPNRESGESCHEPIRVVVAEDSYPIREFLTVILSSAPAREGDAHLLDEQDGEYAGFAAETATWDGDFGPRPYEVV